MMKKTVPSSWGWWGRDEFAMSGRWEVQCPLCGEPHYEDECHRYEPPPVEVLADKQAKARALLIFLALFAGLLLGLAAGHALL